VPLVVAIRHGTHNPGMGSPLGVGWLHGKERKARSADREPHDYCGRPAFIEKRFVARVRAVRVVNWTAFTSITACL